MKSGKLVCSLALGSALMAIAPLIGAQNETKSVPPPAQRAAENAVTGKSHDAGEEGQRVFEQNCSRCHTAPDGFSPRIAGTVVRHMRVRASLSRHDEEVLLRYFNP